MKKIVSTFVFLCLFFSAIQAQDFRFGFQTSPTFSWITSDDTRINGNGTNLGFRLGMLGETYFRENYAFLFGIGFAFNQGGTLQHDMGGNFWPNSELSDPLFNDGNNALADGVNLKYGLQYIELPFALKLKTAEFGYMQGFFEIPRITLGFNTQARGAIESEISTEKEKIEKDVNLLSISWGVGGGLEYNLNENTALVGGIFYQQGFLDVTKDKNAVKSDGSAEDSKARIGSITIRIGVMF